MKPPFENPLINRLLQLVANSTPRLHVADWPRGEMEAKRFTDLLQAQRPDVTFNTTSRDGIDVVVFTHPLPHTPDTVEHLMCAREMLGPDGFVLVPFRNGKTQAVIDAFQSGAWSPPRCGETAAVPVGEYSPVGIELVFSRAGYDITATEDMLAVEETTELAGWIVVGQPRPQRVSPFGQERRERRLRARALNRKGETQYAAGDYAGAAALFSQAIDLWNEDAVFFNNVSSALFAIGQYDESVLRVRDALHLDPNLHAARENYRAIMTALGRREEAEALLALFGHDM